MILGLFFKEDKMYKFFEMLSALKFLLALFGGIVLLYALMIIAFFLNEFFCSLLFTVSDGVSNSNSPGFEESILIVAIFIAAFAMYLNRKNTSEKAALDVLYRFDQDDKLVKAKKVYGAVMRGELYLEEIFPELKDDCSIYHTDHVRATIVIDDEKMTVKEVYDSIIYLLNYMEEMALGVRVGIYNYKIILGARRKDIIKIYFVFEDFIEIGMRKEKIKMYSTSKKVLDRMAIEENKYGIDESSPKMRAKLYEHFEWLVKERLVKDGNRRNVIYTDFPFFYEL